LPHAGTASCLTKVSEELKSGSLAALPGLYVGFRKRASVFAEHDPEKWKPVFRKDHAQSKS
jgi:hypothetical protein